MHAFDPHYLLFCEAVRRPCFRRQWRFVLQPIGQGERVAAADVETDADGNRLELLATVRGLEALEQPSRVTLLTTSRYVRRGLQHDLCQWRDSDFQWERFGQMVPIRDDDLWQRVDRALSIHQVECLAWQADQIPEPLSMLAAGDPAASESCDEPAVVIVPGRRPQLLAPSRRCRAATHRSRPSWRDGAQRALTAFGRPVLSRTG